MPVTAMKHSTSKVRSYYETHERACAVRVEREVFDQFHFDEKYGAIERKRDVRQQLCSTLKCDRRRAGKFFRNFFPIVKWLPAYVFKNCFIGDLVGGINIGIANISQGMAYGMLAGLPPVYGLYTSLFPALFYSIFATSHHNSVGVFAITSIMTRSVIMKYFEQRPVVSDMPIETENDDATTLISSVLGNSTFDNETLMAAISGNSTVIAAELRAQVAVSLTLLVGLLLTIFGVLRLGFLSSYLSDQLVQGLTAGAAVHILTSQVGYLLGLSRIPPTDSNFWVIKYYIALFRRISEVNVITVLLSIMSILMLSIYKEFLIDWFRRKFRFPFPVELFVMIVATGISYGTNLHDRFHVRVVQQIPLGFPAPQMPKFYPMQFMITDAVEIAVVTFAISVSLAKIFSREHKYKIDPNQELLALGISESISSCFACFCACAALSRSGLGGKTQVTNLISCLILVVFLAGIATLFEKLPTCVLSAIIVVNLKSLFLQLKILPSLWRCSKLDFCIYLVTFVAVVVINVRIGLVIGMLFAVISVVIRSQWPDVALLGRVADTDIYKGLHAYKQCQDIPGVKIFRFDAPLYFANADFFKSKLYKTVGIDPLKYRRKPKEPTLCARIGELLAKILPKTARIQPINNQRSPFRFQVDPSAESLPKLSSRVRFQSSSDNSSESVEFKTEPRSESIHHLIIDCSTLPYIDVMGVEALLQIHDEYKAAGITVYLTCCKVEVRRRFETCNFYDSVPKCNLFLDIHDAVLAARTAATGKRSCTEEFVLPPAVDFGCQFSGPAAGDTTVSSRKASTSSSNGSIHTCISGRS